MSELLNLIFLRLASYSEPRPYIITHSSPFASFLMLSERGQLVSSRSFVTVSKIGPRGKLNGRSQKPREKWAVENQLGVS
jgi:hypothetical protein